MEGQVVIRINGELWDRLCETHKVKCGISPTAVTEDLIYAFVLSQEVTYVQQI